MSKSIIILFKTAKSNLSKLLFIKAINIISHLMAGNTISLVFLLVS
jgi:hypothetical protein